MQKVGAYLTKKLEELVEEYDTVKAVKGKGLMQGIQVTKPISEITGAALKEGLLIIGAGSDVIRFVPPLIIELEQVDEMIRILKKEKKKVKKWNIKAGHGTYYLHRQEV